MATEDAVWLADKAGENPDDLPAGLPRPMCRSVYPTHRAGANHGARLRRLFTMRAGPAAELRNQMLGPRTPRGGLRGHVLAL